MYKLIINLIVTCSICWTGTISAITTENIKSNNKVAFIAGYDEDANTYYGNAKRNFIDQGMEIVEGRYSLVEIIDWLNSNVCQDFSWSEVHIICHSNPWRGLSLKATPMGSRITTSVLDKAMSDNKIPQLNGVLDIEAKIIIHSCGLGNNIPLMKRLRDLLTNNDNQSIYSTPYFNIFGGQHSKHYLAKVYYGFYRTAYFPGQIMLDSMFKNKYPGLNLDWVSAINSTNEEFTGSPYSYKFNVPVTWEFSFQNPSDIPALKSEIEIIDWLIQQESIMKELDAMQIPINKFRWSVFAKGNKLKLKGKTTVVCVLLPIMDSEDNFKFQKVSIDNSKLYSKV